MFESFFLIAGPCVLEGDELNLEIARKLADLRDDLGISVIFKSSFDKANRALLESPRGPGLRAGLDQLRNIKNETGLPVLTDIHEPHHAEVAASVVDVLQVPAFLCRQTDLLVAAAATGKPVNVKKGQWMGPEEIAGAVEKLRKSGANEVAVTERGTVHGYGDLVVDMRSFRRIRLGAKVPVIFDGTHSVQRAGRASGSSGGDPDHIVSLSRAAVACGCEGLFLETHPQPAAAPSDGATMLPLNELSNLLREVVAVRAALGFDKQGSSA